MFLCAEVRELLGGHPVGGLRDDRVRRAHRGAGGGAQPSRQGKWAT